MLCKNTPLRCYTCLPVYIAGLSAPKTGHSSEDSLPQPPRQDSPSQDPRFPQREWLDQWHWILVDVVIVGCVS